ncbi:MAG: membrane protein insertion efficiency factor YidD [Campylobacterales bacterium]|nr:membrane protein insertion efficiency factor YidD [Campylobacterales bacterium]
MIIEFYQKYISPLSQPNCRFYPTCSEYGKWQFDVNPYPIALWNTTIRILRCNKLFPGGIDYPIGKCPIEFAYGKKIDVKYWYVPQKNKKCFVIKRLG